MITDTNKIKRQINSVTLFLMLCWMILPVVSFYIGSLGYILLFSIWLLTSESTPIFTSIKKGILFIVWYCCLLFLKLIGVFSYGEVNSLYFFAITAFTILPYYICTYYRYLKNNFKFIEEIKRVFLVLSIITFITTILVTLVYPDAPKVLSMGSKMDVYKEKYQSMNCGGYGMAYGFVISFIPILSHRFTEKKWNCIKKIYIILGFITLIMSQYTIGIIIFFLSLIMYYMFKKSKSKAVFTMRLLFLLLCLVVLLNIADILKLLSSLLSKYTILSVRLSEVAKYFEDGSIGYNFAGRLDVYSVSVNGFFEHPITGGLLWGETLIGGHSTILDLLSLLGIAGTFLYFLFLFNTVKSINNRYYTISFISFLLVSLFNISLYIIPIGLAFYLVSFVFVYKEQEVFH